MVKFKNKYGIFVIFIFVLLLSLYFPITSKDLIYVNVNNLSNFIKTSEGFLISDIFSILITKYKGAFKKWKLHSQKKTWKNCKQLLP